MSSATDDPSAPPAVLTYKQGAAPAIPIAGQPTADELAFDWTLSPHDLQQVWAHRGPANQLRFAIQLCVLRKHGRFLADYGRVPPAVLGYLARQVDIEPHVTLTGRGRDNTEADYQRDILAYLGWRPYEAAVAARLQAWITDQVSRYLYVDHLVEKAEH